MSPMFPALNHVTVAVRYAVRILVTVLVVVLAATAVLLLPAYLLLMVFWFHAPSRDVLILTVPATVALLLLAWIFAKIIPHKLPSVHAQDT